MTDSTFLPTRRSITVSGAALACGLVGLAPRARAARPLRIGVVASYSGPHADYGRQFDAGMAVYLQAHGDRLGGRPVEIVRKDTAGPVPDAARRHAQELVVRHRVDILTGLDFSPNALAIAPIATRAKIPTLVMNAASAGLTEASPYFARVSFTVPQVVEPMARHMLEAGVRDAVSVVADYSAGVDAETAFGRMFTAGGGAVTGALRTPANSLDFTPYLQRVADHRPRAVFFFLPSGDAPRAFLKAWKERGLDAAGIALFATGEATDDGYLQATGDAALGLVTAHHYSAAHASPANRRFVDAFTAAHGPALRPNYFAVAAHDAMAALDTALIRTQGDADGDRLMQALRGLRLDSPRGTLEIDAATRDVVQTVYLRRTERVAGQLVNTEFGRYDAVSARGTASATASRRPG